MVDLSKSLQEIGTTKIVIFAGLGVFFLIFFVILALYASSPTYTPLYTGLSLDDSNHIISQLDAEGVPYEVKAGGSQILVPANQVLKVRMKMAGSGLPSSGSIVGYEIFDNPDSFGTSNFLYNVNYVRAMEGELSRTIGAIRNIDNARVHLVIPKKELFAKERAHPTASVVVKMVGGNRLDKNEIASIRHLVATAVPGLQPSRITLVDNQGRLLARGTSEEDDPDAAVAEAGEYRKTYERNLKNTLEALLEETVGIGRARVEVSADIDFDRIVSTSEEFDPDGQVARSVQTIEERETASEGGNNPNVTVANNLPDAAGGAAGGGNGSTSERIDETTNFEISKTVQNHIKEVGTVNKLSIAVLVDGTYETVDIEDEEGELISETKYVPRSEDELAKLVTLVKSAIGYDETRGDTVEIVNMPFHVATDEAASESLLDWLKRDMNNILQTLIFGVVAVLGILIVLRPIVNKMVDLTASSVTQEEEESALEGPEYTPGVAELTGDEAFSSELPEGEEEVLIDIDKVKGKVKSSSIKRISALIEEHPEESLSVLRQWMMAGREA